MKKHNVNTYIMVGVNLNVEANDTDEVYEKVQKVLREDCGGGQAKLSISNAAEFDDFAKLMKKALNDKTVERLDVFLDLDESESVVGITEDDTE